MKIDRIETTVLEMPYKKPLITATNNFTVARGSGGVLESWNHGFRDAINDGGNRYES
jgi:hypothetical protein